MNVVKDMRSNYRCVQFVNLFMSSLGVLSNERSTFLEMMNDIAIDKTQQHYISLAIRATYFIFCSINKTWDSPDITVYMVRLGFRVRVRVRV